MLGMTSLGGCLATTKVAAATLYISTTLGCVLVIIIYVSRRFSVHPTVVPRTLWS